MRDILDRLKPEAEIVPEDNMAEVLAESVTEEFDNLIEADLKRFLAAAGAAGLIAGSAVAAHKVGGDNAPQVQYSDEEPLWGEGDWGYKPPQEREQVRLAPGRGGSVQFSSRDVAYLAATMWGEGRSEGDQGMKAVGLVALNRLRTERWGDTLQEVVRARKQFSCWNSDDPNRAKINRMGQIERYLRTHPDEDWMTKFESSEEYPEYLKWVKARKLARAIVSGQVRDFTGGATFYHTTAVNPYWAPTMTEIGRIGSHIFYTDRD